jgi:hypothetical protein
MRKFVALALTSSALFASGSKDFQLIVPDENPTSHYFSPKIFYRYHRESNYNFKTFGIGLEYNLHRPKGINVQVRGMSNLSALETYIESEQMFLFRFPWEDNKSIYPLLGSKVTSHKIESSDEKDLYINKNIFCTGLGFELSDPNKEIKYKIEGILFRDTNNSMLMKENDNFWGKLYSNPYGGKIKIGLNICCADSFYADIESYFASTFQKCYREVGAQIACNWRF